MGDSSFVIGKPNALASMLQAVARNRAPGADAPASSAGILAPGRNCWRVERARALAFLIDGEAYFSAVRSALARARHSIFILGWDVDSRMRLVPDGAHDGFPDPLAEFLNAVVAGRSGLRGYLLSWDFAMLYAIEREWLPIYKLDWSTHRRLSFRLDDCHPAGASHHQKIVVIDDAVAFVSGYDLTRCRWDTSAHEPRDPRRVDHRGVPYPPFHDVGIVVAGECAAALGELARERWQRATGTRPRRRVEATFDEVWPEGVAPEARDVDVAIARTDPAFMGRPGVTEVRALHEDAIASARRHIFGENQYFTSRTITEAFARRLRDDEGPEIAVVSPYTQSGWLEISTMGVLRARVHRALREADRHGRYRLYCPMLPWLDHRVDCLNVHSKVLVVDDEFLTVGSANLSERSMAVDTECNVAIEARGDERLRALIASVRDRLLGEHLQRTPQEVAAAIRERGGLHAAIAALAREDARTLKAVEPEVDPALESIVPEGHVFDPERPLDPDTIVADLVPREPVRADARARLIGVALGVVALACMAAAWRYTPLRDYVELDRLVALGAALSEQPWAPAAVLAAFVGGGLVAFPLLLLIAVTATVFGPLLGAFYSLVGALLSAVVTFAIGRRLGRETVRRIAGGRVNDLSRRLAQRGLVAIAFVRMLPVAPFSVVNVVAGASHIRWADFVLGTAIGLLPGIGAMSVFVDRAVAAIRQPGPGTFMLLAGAVVIIVLLIWAVRRNFGLRTQGQMPAVPPRHGS